MKLFQTLMFLAKELRASFGYLHRGIITGARASERQRCGLDSVFDFANDLALANGVASINIKASNRADRRARQLDGLLRLDHAIEFSLSHRDF